MSLHIEGRRWFQKTYGNTYHSVRIFKDGQVIAHLPYQYGYGDGYLQTALDWLRANGNIPDVCANCGKPREGHPQQSGSGLSNHYQHGFMPHYGTQYVRETLGGTYSVIDVTRKGDL